MVKKISELPAASALTGSEVPIANQSGVTSKVSSLDLVSARTKSYIEGDGDLSVDTSGDHTGTIDGVSTAQVAYKNANNVFSVAQQFNAEITGASGDFSGSVEAAGFTIGGVPVGTSTDTYWSADGSGNITYGGGTIDPAGGLLSAQIAAIDKIVDSTANIVDIFIYDTSKDSDNGAWRDKCEEKSWYQEFVNSGTTATRGSKAEHPAMSVIVATTTAVTIYDLDKPEAPMWMVYNRSLTPGGMNGNHFYTGNSSSVTAKNGIIYHGRNTSGAALAEYNFIKDTGNHINITANYLFPNNIENRNNQSQAVSVSSNAIVNNTVNDVTAKVLPNAPIDETTGLPIATVAVATDGGYSIINPDGTVYDGICTQAAHGKVKNISFTSSNKIIYIGFDYNTASRTRFVRVDTIITTDTTITTVVNEKQNSDEFYMATYTSGTGEDLYILASSSGTTGDVVAGKGNVFFGQNSGLTLLDRDTTTPANGMVNYITTTYNTGWMPGDIKGAWLSSNDDTNLSGSELVTNGTFDTDTDWNKGTGWTIAGGVATCDGTQVSATQFWQSGVFNNGDVAWIKFDVTSYTAGTISASLHSVWSAAISSVGSYEFPITASTDWFKFNASSDFIGSIDNVSCILADPDRSVNGNGLQVFGTIDKDPVATGAELMAYSGFTAANNLIAPSNSDWDELGTGAAYESIWFKTAGNNINEHYVAIANAGDSIELKLIMLNTGFLSIRDDGATAQVVATTTTAYDDGQWHKADFVRTSSTERYLYVDGIEVLSETTDAGSLSDSGNLPLGIGVDADGSTSPAITSSLALAKISAYAPTQEQIKKMYETEKYLFQENSQCCLSESDDVQDLSYDEDTELLYVATDDGTDVFKGLQRVDYIDNSGTPTSDNCKAVSASNGSYAIGTGAEAVVNVPEINIREELLKIQEVSSPSEGVTEMSNLTTPSNLNADTVTTAELADIVGNLIDKLQERGIVTQ